MQYKIAMERGFLRAELLERETAEETRRFLRAVVFESVRHSCPRILVHVRSSKTLFTVERYGVLETFKKLASNPDHRIAFLGDTVELGLSHDYAALLARQQGITLRNFQNEWEAVQWVRDRRRLEDRRQQSEPTRSTPLERRLSHRRKPPTGGSPDITPA
jgi:translation initiation factor 2 beta subunit (eIF-2beta)/eIF-5